MPVNPASLDNILESVKTGIGIQLTDEAFDATIIIHINTVMMNLNQLGVGPETVFEVQADGAQLWSEFLPDGEDTTLSAVKSYTILKVQSMFDPSGSGVVNNAMTELVKQYEYRLLTAMETKDTVLP